MPARLHCLTRSRRAQSTVEYMLLLSVIVLGLWAATQQFALPFRQGLEAMSGDVQGMTEDGYVGGGR